MELPQHAEVLLDTRTCVPEVLFNVPTVQDSLSMELLLLRKIPRLVKRSSLLIYILLVKYISLVVLLLFISVRWKKLFQKIAD